MNDEGNVVVEAASTPEINIPGPATQTTPSVKGDTTVINNNVVPTQQEGSNNQITEPIADTQATDINVATPAIPLGKTDITTPAPLVGSNLNDIQVIEMMDQQARSSIYSQEELNQAGLDSQLYSAIAYNEQKNRAMAIDEYHIKLDKANKEAEHTGYYIAPEDSDMVTQHNMAEYMLKQPNITNAQRTKAERTLATVDNYFKTKGISMKGVVTLDKILKEKYLDVLRAQNAVSAGEVSNMIAAQDLSILQAIYSSLELGDSPEKIAALYKGVMNQEDVYTIANSYYKAHGDNAMFFNKMANLTDAEFKQYTQEIKGITYKDQPVYKYTYDGKTSYIYGSTRTDAYGNSELIYKEIPSVPGTEDLRSTILNKDNADLKVSDITKVYTKKEMLKRKEDLYNQRTAAVIKAGEAFDKSEKDKGGLYYWTLGGNVFAEGAFNKTSKDYKEYQRIDKEYQQVLKYLEQYK